MIHIINKSTHVTSLTGQGFVKGTCWARLHLVPQMPDCSSRVPPRHANKGKSARALNRTQGTIPQVSLPRHQHLDSTSPCLMKCVSSIRHCSHEVALRCNHWIGLASKRLCDFSTPECRCRSLGIQHNDFHDSSRLPPTTMV